MRVKGGLKQSKGKRQERRQDVSNTATLLLCHGSGDPGLFVVGYIMAMAPLTVAVGFIHALIRLIKELHAAE